MSKIEQAISIIDYQDVPQAEGLTSSIGGLWPPEPASFDRVKGFYTVGVISTQDQAEEIISNFIESVKFDEDVSRYQYRFVIKGKLLKQYLAKDPRFQKHVEAIVELDPGKLGANPVMIYLSANSPERQSHQTDWDQVLENIHTAQQIQPKSVEEVFDRVDEYRVEILQIPEDEAEFELLLVQVAALYERFGWERQDVAEILKNPNNLFAAAYDGDRIVSAGIAEFASVPIGDQGQAFEIVEITEAATLDDHQNKGLYNAVSTALQLEIARQIISGRDIDLVFGECNGLSRGVLTVAKQQGRVFAVENGAKYGFPNSGILIQSVPINGPAKVSNLNDLVPAYLTRSAMIHRYGPYVTV